MQEWITHGALPSICFNLTEAIWSLINEEERKQARKERKTNRIITLDTGNDIQRSITDASLKQNHCRIHKVALNENLPTFSTVSSFIVQFNKSQFRRLGLFCYYKRNFQNCELLASIQSAEYQMTVLLKLLIILCNHMNVSTINQSKSLPQVLGYWCHSTALVACWFKCLSWEFLFTIQGNSWNSG